MLDINNSDLLKHLFSEDLLYIHKAGKNIIIIKDKKEKHTYRISFVHLVKIVPRHIIRVHTSFMANINKIEDIIIEDSFPYKIIISGGEIPFSRRYYNSI